LNLDEDSWWAGRSSYLTLEKGIRKTGKDKQELGRIGDALTGDPMGVKQQWPSLEMADWEYWLGCLLQVLCLEWRGLEE